MKARKFITLLLGLTVANASAQTSAMKESDLQINAGYAPQNGFIPDKNTAATVATAVLIPIYGKANVLKQRPFDVSLHDGVWIVRGALPREMVGGVAEVRISKATGAILRVTHTK